MRLLNFLSGIAPVLVCLAAPTEGGGNPAPASAAPPEPTGSTLEEKLTSAKTIIADFFRQLGGAMREKDEAVSNLATVTAERDGAVQARDQFKGQVATLTTERDTLTTQVAGLTTERDTARTRVTQVEAFAKGHGLDIAGIDAAGAAKTVPEAQDNKDGKALYDEWRRLKNSGEGKKATVFFRKHKAELNEYAESTR